MYRVGMALSYCLLVHFDFIDRARDGVLTKSATIEE